MPLPPPPVDVRVDVTVVAPADAPAIEPVAPAPAPALRWLTLTVGKVLDADTSSQRDLGGSTLRGTLEVDRGVIRAEPGGAISWIVGVDAGRMRSSAFDANATFNTVVATDTQALVYGGIAAATSRVEAQLTAGAGIEHTAGMIYGEGDAAMRPVSAFGPVVDVGGTIYVRLHGRLAAAAGARMLGHLARYEAPDGMSTFLRDPAFEVFGGLAVATY